MPVSSVNQYVSQDVNPQIGTFEPLHSFSVALITSSPHLLRYPNGRFNLTCLHARLASKICTYEHLSTTSAHGRENKKTMDRYM